MLNQVSAALGRSVTVAGTTQGPQIETLAENGVFPQDMERVIAAKNRHERDLMSQPSVIGVGVAADANSGNPAIVIYVDRAMGDFLFCRRILTT